MNQIRFTFFDFFGKNNVFLKKLSLKNWTLGHFWTFFHGKILRIALEHETICLMGKLFVGSKFLILSNLHPGRLSKSPRWPSSRCLRTGGSCSPTTASSTASRATSPSRRGTSASSTATTATSSGSSCPFGESSEEEGFFSQIFTNCLEIAGISQKFL